MIKLRGVYLNNKRIFENNLNIILNRALLFGLRCLRVSKTCFFLICSFEKVNSLMSLIVEITGKRNLILFLKSNLFLQHYIQL